MLGTVRSGHGSLLPQYIGVLDCFFVPCGEGPRAVRQGSQADGAKVFPVLRGDSSWLHLDLLAVSRSAGVGF